MKKLCGFLKLQSKYPVEMARWKHHKTKIASF